MASAEVVLPCTDIDATVDWFTARLGFRLDLIMPADGPSIAVLTGHGLAVRLEVGGGNGPGQLRLPWADPAGRGTVTGPNGTVVHLVDPDPPLTVPPGSAGLELTRPAQTESAVGRAGMHYRDLLPTRQGGRFIASHILIPAGGPVPDYVHHHQVRFQLIYCAAGWVRVVYEDQGPAFVLETGDCVLQPPGIRHRVLEASAGLEVVEIGCPAEHPTFVEHEITLPTPEERPERRFGAQLFVRHVAATAAWRPWRCAGYECRDTGIAAATDGLVGVRVVRASNPGPARDLQHDGEFQFWYVLQGTGTLVTDGTDSAELTRGVAVSIPARTPHALVDVAADLELLEVTLPA